MLPKVATEHKRAEVCFALHFGCGIAAEIGVPRPPELGAALLFGLLGLLVGHFIGAIESYYFNLTLGQSIEWYRISYAEIVAILIATAIAALAGLVPAIKAYSSPVAVNLTAA